MDTTLLQIKTLRAAIRQHRDQRGDDRCWLDDFRLWTCLADTLAEPSALPPLPEMLRRCAAFYRFRRAEAPDLPPPDAIRSPERWDADLAGRDEAGLEEELGRLEEAVRAHRDIPPHRERTIDDDRRLYRVLPEGLVADFRLPPETEFLGEAKAPAAGCPSFWRSHQGCPSARHDLHAWGPCKP